MSERDRGDNLTGRPAAEGVRIIKAEEAQAAIDAGEAAGRRPDDQLRFGDVPPAPAGPRPAHRFPLPDSVDPAAAVELPPLAPTGRSADTGSGARHFRRPGARSGPGQTGGRAPAADPGSSPAANAGSVPAPAVDRGSAADPGPAPTAGTFGGSSPGGDPTRVFAGDPPPPGSGPAGEADWSGRREPPPPFDPPAPPRFEATAEPAARRFAAGEPAAERPLAPPSVAGWEPAAAPARHRPPSPEPPSFTASTGERTTELGVTDIPEEGITVSAAPPEMPHWTDPPTGEVPRLRFDDDPDDAGPDSELEAWNAVGGKGVRWRHEDDWDEADDLTDLTDMGDEGEPMGALDQSRTEHSDLYSFDEDFERVAAARTGSHPVIDDADADADDDSESDFAEYSHRRYAGVGRRGRRRSVAARRADERRPVEPALRTRASRSDLPGDETGDDWGPGPVSGKGVPLAGAAGGRSLRRAASTTTVPRGGRTTSGGRGPGGGGTEGRRPGAAGTGNGPARRDGGDVGSRVAIGAVLVVLLIICYAIGSEALVVLSTVIVAASAAEGYNMTRGAGFRPATLLGLVATVGTVLAAYWEGLAAIPIVAVLLFAGTMLWYVLGVVEARPLANAAVTVMVYLWVGVLGAFSGVLLRHGAGRGLFLGAIVVAVAADIAAFGVGRAIGSRPMAPGISPNKTIEGYIGGIVGALIVGAIVGKTVTPWGGMKHGLLLGLAIGVIAPAGDLFESMLKRDLNLKDSGTALGGHGGLLDRFDAILLALPAAYFVALLDNIIKTLT